MTTMDTIVRAAIHPSIGIARVGDSSDAFFIGPELPYPTPAPEGGYKDTSGFLKRQAARFRIFGYDSRNRVVEELTCDNAEIEWTVPSLTRRRLGIASTLRSTFRKESRFHVETQISPELDA